MAETETSTSRDRDETETLTISLETRPRRDVGTSRDRLETETLRPRPQLWYNLIIMNRWKFLTGPRLPYSQPQSIIALWLESNCTAWWQRHVGVNSLPRVIVWQWNGRESPHATSWSRVRYPTGNSYHHGTAYHYDRQPTISVVQRFHKGDHKGDRSITVAEPRPWNNLPFPPTWVCTYSRGVSPAADDALESRFSSS